MHSARCHSVFSFVPWYKHLELACCKLFKIASHLSSLLHLSFAFWSVLYPFFSSFLLFILLYFLCCVVSCVTLWFMMQKTARQGPIMNHIFQIFHYIGRGGSFCQLFCMANTKDPNLLMLTGHCAVLVEINFKTQSLSSWQEHPSNQLGPER